MTCALWGLSASMCIVVRPPQPHPHSIVQTQAMAANKNSRINYNHIDI